MPRNTVGDFWKKVNIKGLDDCWWGTANKNKKGYGQMNLTLFGESHILCHRISWILDQEKPIPKGLHVLHSCDHKSCCNPNHLHLGTNLQNVLEAIQRGKRPGRVILTNEDVLFIRKMKGTMTYQKIADLFKVHRSTIGRIINRQRRSKI